MCGACTNYLAIETLRESVGGVYDHSIFESYIDSYVLLREYHDFASIIKIYSHYVTGNSSADFGELQQRAFLHRGIDILLTNGFESAEYQSLLSNSYYCEAVNSLCSAENRREFESVTKDLCVTRLSSLYCSETYLCSSQQVANDFFDECGTLLTHYISWRLEGIGLGRNDLLAIMETTGIMDPINDITADDRNRFAVLCRAIYFSLLLVERIPNGQQLLETIALKRPVGIAGSEGDELWLQRIAILKLYDLQGFDKFLDYVSKLGATNFYFLDIARGFTKDQRQRLLDEASQYPKEEVDDSFVSFSDWLSGGR